MLNDLRIRVRSLFRRRAVEVELNDELRFHLERQTGKYVALGMPRDEAARRARIELGGLEQMREECRHARGVRLAESLWQDAGYGLRLLRRSPVFTAVAILTLALGIGANTAIFTLLDALVLRNLPVPQPEQLVRFGAQLGDDSSAGLSLPMFEGIGRDQKVFSSMFAWSGDGVVNVETAGRLVRADLWCVSGNYQSELGATPELGRLIGPSDVNLEAAAPAQVAVLSFGFWQRHYGGAGDVIGRTMRIEGYPFTIIGVTRRGFRGISADDITEVTVPLTAEPLIYHGPADIQKQLRRPDARWLEAAGRLMSGMRLEQARAQLDSLWPAILQSLLPELHTAAERDRLLAFHLKIESGAKGASYLRGKFAQPLVVLLAISGLVALVACVNLASLMLSRAASRSHELGVRVALGAGRARLAQQMLTESLALSVAGTLAGFALAQWGSRALANFIVGETYIVPAALNLSPDLRVLGFTAAAAILAGVLFGTAPAWRASREDPLTSLQLSARTVGSRTGLLGRSLIVTQVALSVILLAGAGLFLRSLNKLQGLDPGFRTRGMLVVHLFPVPGGYKDLNWADYYRQLTERISGLPGVVSAGISHMTPGVGGPWTQQFRVSGSGGVGVASTFAMVMPGAFRAMGVPLVRGREFSWADNESAPHVAVVSRSFAAKFFPGADPIGRRLEITTQPKWKEVEIVGVVGDASMYEIRDVRPPTVYVSPIQYGDYSGWPEVLVQTENSPAAMAPTIRQVVESFGRESVFSVKTVQEGIGRSLLRERVTAMLSAYFGGLALLLAAIGLYGLMAYSVTKRTREIGIRMALGASPKSVRTMVLRETFVLAALGLAIGLPCAIAASRMIARMLYGVAGHDGPTLLGVCVVLAAAAGLAGFLPARRATRLDPMVALRQE